MFKQTVLSTAALAAPIAMASGAAFADTRDTHERYLEAMNTHDLETLDAMTAADFAWTIDGVPMSRAETLDFHRFAMGMGIEYTWHDVVVRGDVVAFTLCPSSDLVHAVGMPVMRIACSCTYRGDVQVHRTTTESADMVEFQRRRTPFYAWVAESHPDLLPSVRDENGLVFSQRAGEITNRLVAEWLDAGAPGRLPVTAGDLHRMFTDAARAGDLESMGWLTAPDVEWKIGDRTLIGREEALGPPAYAIGMGADVGVENVVVSGDVVDFEVTVDSDVMRAVGAAPVRHYVRFVVADGRLVRKETRHPSDGLEELDRRLAPLMRWIGTHRPETRVTLRDREGRFRYSYASGRLMRELVADWVADGSPGRLPAE